MPPPNILLLCPDELKAAALGCYGQDLPVSPFLDALADKGALFEQCHTVHTKCTPSRAALVTAQYPHVGGHRTLDMPVRMDETNLLRTLRAGGYQTALFGKNHVVDEETLPHSFDHWTKNGGKATLEPTSERMPPGSYWVGHDPIPMEEWNDHVNTENALKWLKQQPIATQSPLYQTRDEEKPFFLWLNWSEPHPPYGAPSPFYGRLDRDKISLPPRDDDPHKPAFQRHLQEVYGLDAMSDADWRELIATYLEMVMLIDAEVQRIFAALGTLNLLENTIVVFWSDHGDFAGEHGLVEKWDTAFYECITRVPLLFHAPAHIKAARHDALVESIDIMPTILDLCGVALPTGIQGRSLQAVLTGQTRHHRDLVLCQGGQEAEMFDRVVAPDAKERQGRAYQAKQRALWEKPATNARAKMIRDRRWKYCFRQSGPEELYDLESDPHELRNLAFDKTHETTLQQYRLKMIEKLVDAETVAPHQSYLEA